MWARVKAEAERDLMNEFDALCWRPAMIGGTPGARPPFYLVILRPVLTLLFKPIKSVYIENVDIGRAMLEATRQGLRRRIFENPEMRDLASTRVCKDRAIYFIDDTCFTQASTSGCIGPFVDAYAFDHFARLARSAASVAACGPLR